MTKTNVNIETTTTTKTGTENEIKTEMSRLGLDSTRQDMMRHQVTQTTILAASENKVRCFTIVWERNGSCRLDSNFRTPRLHFSTARPSQTGLEYQTTQDLHATPLHSTPLHCIPLHYTRLHYTAPLHTTPHHATLHAADLTKLDESRLNQTRLD